MKLVSEKIQSEAKEQKIGFLGMLLGALGANLLRKMLTGKGVMRAGKLWLEQVKERLELVRILNATQSFDFEIQIDYQNESKFNCVYPRNNLPKIKDGAYVINLDEHKSIGSQ